MHGVLHIAFCKDEQEVLRRAAAHLYLIPKSPILTETKAQTIQQICRKMWDGSYSSGDLEAFRGVLELLMIQLPDIIPDLEHRKGIHILIEQTISLLHTATGHIYRSAQCALVRLESSVPLSPAPWVESGE